MVIPVMDRSKNRDRLKNWRFAKFAAIGTVAFIVDSAALLLFLRLGLGPFVGRLLSFAIAVTVTWYLNRVFTFGDLDRKWGRQWLRFVSVNSIGGAINLAVYTIAILASPLVAAHPVLGVAAGAIAGLGWNYGMSSLVVFTRGNTEN